MSNRSSGCYGPTEPGKGYIRHNLVVTLFAFERARGIEMKRHAIIAVAICLIFLGNIQSVGTFGLQPVVSTDIESNELKQSIPAETGSASSLRTNMVRNGGFEEESGYGGEGQWDRGGSIYRQTDFDYTNDVSNGTYSCRMRAEGAEYWGSYSYLHKAYYAHDMGYLGEGSELNISYNIVQNPDLARGATVYTDFNFYNGSTYYLYYYLSSSISPGSNSSNRGYYLFNTTTFGDWNLFSRNITADFEAAIGPITTDLEIRFYYFRITTVSHASGTNEVIVDDVHLRNSTGHEYIEDGGFESGNGAAWYDSSDSDKGYYSHSTESTEGDYAANLTVKASRSDVSGYSRVYHRFNRRSGYYPLGPDTFTIHFDWMYDDVSGGGTDQYGRYELEFDNDTYSGTVYWYLGIDQDQVPSWNSSGSSYANYHVAAPGFGERGMWHHFEIDLYQVALDFNITQVNFNRGEFMVEQGDEANSSATLLVDRYSFNAYPAGDPGFEVDYAWIQNIPSWSVWSFSMASWSLSSDSMVGDYAANATLTSDGTEAIYRPCTLEIDRWTYTDFWWRLDEISLDSGNSYAYILLSLEGGYYLYYMLGTNNYDRNNDSSSAVYYVDGFNTTGTWNNINRNITHDLNASLGLHSWNLTQIVLYVHGEASGRISVLFDELHFQDMKGPEIQSVALTPAAPEYHETAGVDIQATDNLATIDLVNVLYRDDGSWMTVEAEYNFGKWTATLPALAYGLERQYYVEIADTSGMQDTDDNDGAYYSYSSTDTVDPMVTISSPGGGITVQGEVQFEIAAEDPGSGSSGLAYLEVWQGEVLIYNDSSSPFEFMWDSRMTSNGTKSIGAFAYDAAGNIATDNVSIDVQNDVAPPLIYGLQVNPTAPEYGEEVTLSLVCSDVTGVENATLYYAVEDTAAFSRAQSWISVNMSSVGMLYSGSIPAQEYGKTVLYYVAAYDTFGQESSIGSDTAPLSYEVADTQAPTMNVYAPSSSEPVRGVVTFNITASDAASGIAEIQFYVDGSLVDDSSGDSASFEWDTTTLENGEHTVTFVAVDGAGNEVSSSIEYEVLNPDAFGGFGESLSSIMASYGLFIGLAGGIVLVLVVQALLKKRGK